MAMILEFQVYRCAQRGNGANDKRVYSLKEQSRVIIMDDAGRNNALGIRRSGTEREFRLPELGASGSDVRVR